MSGQDPRDRLATSPEGAGKDVIEWQEMMGWSDATARERLGIGSQNTWRSYRENGAPLTVALAMQALAHRLQPWGADPKASRGTA